MRLWRVAVRALALSGLGGATLLMAQEPSATVPASALKACAALAAPAPRLACYDELAGRQPSPAPVAAPAARADPAPTQSFGLYAAEHPAPTISNTVSARILAVGSSANGHPTVTLEGGQRWELDGPDALLADGDAITIKRAAFGSFLMTTQQGRMHRVRRLH